MHIGHPGEDGTGGLLQMRFAACVRRDLGEDSRGIPRQAYVARPAVRAAMRARRIGRSFLRPTDEPQRHRGAEEEGDLL